MQRLAALARRDDAQPTFDEWRAKSATGGHFARWRALLAALRARGALCPASGAGWLRAAARNDRLLVAAVLATVVYVPFDDKGRAFVRDVVADVVRNVLPGNVALHLSFYGKQEGLQSAHTAEALLVECDDIAFLSWRGTDSIHHWLKNANIGVKELLVKMAKSAVDGSDDHSFVHRGFLSYAESLWEETYLLGKLSAFFARCSSAARLVITGHSLGGAASLIAALLMRNNIGHEKIAYIATFGQPKAIASKTLVRIMDEDFSDRYYRVVEEADVVPGVPGLTYGERHGDTIVHYLHCGMKVVLRHDPTSNVDDEDELHGLKGRLQRYYEGHSPSRYVDGVFGLFLEDSGAESPEEAESQTDAILNNAKKLAAKFHLHI